jgi:hypothetical protein
MRNAFAYAITSHRNLATLMLSPRASRCAFARHPEAVEREATALAMTDRVRYHEVTRVLRTFRAIHWRGNSFHARLDL